MRPNNPFPDLVLGEWLETFLPDFVLAFTFFTALTYAALAKRFDRQRPAIAISASLGLALAIGLVWWEAQNDYSLRDLGPLAVGFFVIALAGVMYQAVRQIGGSWAGAGIALGASLLIARLLGAPWPFAAEILQTLTFAALVVGILAFMLHRGSTAHSQGAPLPRPGRQTRQVEQGWPEARRVSKWLQRRLHGLRRNTPGFSRSPSDTAEVATQIQRILPAQGWLTERMAQLRRKAHQVRNGHVARLEETRHVLDKLPVGARKRAAAQVTAGYARLAGIDERLERLDRAVATNEAKIRQITAAAVQAARKYDHRRLADLLKAAEKLQKHNAHLFRLIGSAEAGLSAVAKEVAQKTREADHA
jgi:hypothetical protein